MYKQARSTKKEGLGEPIVLQLSSPWFWARCKANSISLQSFLGVGGGSCKIWGKKLKPKSPQLTNPLKFLLQFFNILVYLISLNYEILHIITRTHLYYTHTYIHIE